MWIRTQNKQRIINSDQIIDIFVGRTGTKIVANTTCYDLDASEVVLGEYQDRDTCLVVLDYLVIAMDCDSNATKMPSNEEIEEWADVVLNMAKAKYFKDFKI